jgi:hypothetical protein
VSRVIDWRRTTAEQALYYWDHQNEFAAYSGEYVLLQDQSVVWHDVSSQIGPSRRELARHNPDQALWLKYVDPAEAEGEHYAMYERALERLKQVRA